MIVYLNRFDPGVELHARNHDWLVTREGLEVVTDPEALEGVVGAGARYFRLMRLGGVNDAVLPSSSVMGPIGLLWPAVASYLMN